MSEDFQLNTNESENSGITFSFCWLGIHSWSGWKDIRHGSLLQDSIVVGYYLYQEKRCVHCNKAKLRTLHTI